MTKGKATATKVGTNQQGLKHFGLATNLRISQMKSTKSSTDMYAQFDFAEPLVWSHNKVEGKNDYTSLLYIPSKAPWDMMNRDHKSGSETVRSTRIYHG